MAVAIRELRRDELGLIAAIDRRERIDVLYEQRGTELVAKPGDVSSHGWDADAIAEHVALAEGYLDAGGVALGAFEGERFVGLGIVVPHLRPGIAQLGFLHVTAPARATGIGRQLCERMDEIARAAGDTTMVVTATPSENTVRFYRGRGFEPMAEPLPELFALEPEDIHLHKVL